MNLHSIRYAVNSFGELKDEFDDAVQQLGLQTLICMVRQHHMDTDRGWAFFDIGLDEFEEGSGKFIFWGKLVEVRAGKEKQILVILDPETIDSLEFEVYDPRPDGS